MHFTRKHAASTAARGLAGVRDAAPAAYWALRSRSHALDRALSRRHRRQTRAQGPEDAGRRSSKDSGLSCSSVFADISGEAVAAFASRSRVRRSRDSWPGFVAGQES